MFSPALRNRQKILAGLAGKTAAAPVGAARRRTLAEANAGTSPGGAQAAKVDSEYAALLAVLHENLRSLSDIQSHEARQPKKAEYARQFETWVKGVIEADEPVQDEIVVTMMIWAVDCHDWSWAIVLGGFVIRHGLELPERYKRTPACFLAEEIAEIALAPAGDVPHEVLLMIGTLVEGADMPDQVAAKLQKAIGRSWQRKAEAFDPAAESAAAGGVRAFFDAALTACKRALTLDQSVGVKKDIERLEREQKKLAEAVTAES